LVLAGDLTASNTNATIATGMTLSATGVAASGVTYPPTAPAGTKPADGILGTVLAPGATATWHYSASLPLTSASLHVIPDAERAGWGTQTRGPAIRPETRRRIFQNALLTGSNRSRQGQVDRVPLAN
jgi:hypothetical protein